MQPTRSSLNGCRIASIIVCLLTVIAVSVGTRTAYWYAIDNVGVGILTTCVDSNCIVVSLSDIADAGGALFTIVCLMIAAAALGGLGIILHLSMPVGGICVLIAGCLAIGGTGYFVIESTKDNDLIEVSDFGWSFWLAAIGGFLLAVDGLCVLIWCCSNGCPFAVCPQESHPPPHAMVMQQPQQHQQQFNQQPQYKY